MNNLACFKATCSVETALKKLKKVNIAVYRLKKHGPDVYFAVEEEYTQKVFAIFAHPCYNISIKRKSVKTRLKNLLAKRAGLVIGAALFIFACAICDGLVLKVKVVGNGAYLSEQVLAAANDCGARFFAPSSRVDKPMLTSRILSFPSVTFCSVQRRGSYLIIDVRTDEQNGELTRVNPLVSDVDGRVREIVVLSGTAEVEAGEAVGVGQTLIGAYRLTEDEERQNCLAVGFVSIVRTADITLFFESESEENTAKALAATALYSDEVIKREYSVAKCAEGVNYNVTFEYVVTQSINME